MPPTPARSGDRPDSARVLSYDSERVIVEVETSDEAILVFVRPLDSISKDYFAWFLSSETGGQEQLIELQRGATKVGLGLADIASVTVVLPPLAEQEEIVRRVEVLFALAASIEARMAKTQSQVDKPTPSLLAKAFRGELVSQNPNDEPASVLLQPIRNSSSPGDTAPLIMRRRRQPTSRT